MPLRSLLVIALCAATLFGLAGGAQASNGLAIDRVFGKAGSWTIGVSESLGGCVATGTYNDETTVWIGFSGEDNSAYIAFTNPNWASIEPEKSYRIRIRTDRMIWNGTFIGFRRGNENGLYSMGLKSQFLFDLARAGGIRVLFEDKLVAQLSLRGSSAALSDTVGCHKQLAASKEPLSGKKKESSGSFGTGFFVSKEGHILTNHHVIDGCSHISFVRPGAPAEQASLVAGDRTNDLALLRSGKPQDSVPALASQTRLGESVFVYGFPLANLLATSGNFTVGHVSALAGLSDDSRMLQISAPVQAGNSGGPLIDRSGNVVGVIVSKLNALRVAAATTDLPQNVNFAIKSSIAANFLSSNNIVPAAKMRDAELAPTTIAEEAKKFTVQIFCK
jgi:serine protease Do